MPKDTQSEVEKLFRKVNRVMESDSRNLPLRVLEFLLKAFGGCLVAAVLAVVAAMVLGTLYGGLSPAVGNVPAFLILAILVVIVIVAVASKPQRRG
jgi:hypothetical protein